MVKQYRSPGPKYNAPSTIGYEKTDPRVSRAPAYSLGPLLGQQHRTVGRVPGPKYDLGKATRHGLPKATGALLLAPRPREPIARIPGPATYNVLHCMPVIMPSMPVYSIGTRRDRRGRTLPTPAPNAYPPATTIGGNGAPDMPSAPMYSILGRRAEPGGKGRRLASFSSPGPARYQTVPADRYLLQTPRPVMLGRYDGGPGGRAARRTPAPNAYLPTAAAASLRYANAPQFSIAGRYPERADPYYTAADRVPDWEC